MIRLIAQDSKKYEDEIEVSIELGGSECDMQEELKLLLYHLYRQSYEEVGANFVKSLYKATRDAMGRFNMEVVTDGKL